ncbi:MAG: methylenetetrahydrofolate reductase [NAD(P)H] [Ignavibacteria bacterium]|nr:methylenetetrahydrofolate reductase [NAD(P)H] [Ignavibacteria bacterium]
MIVADLLKNTKRTLFSFELLPPLKGKSIQEIYDAIEPLLEFNPAYINVTYHREEVVYKKRNDGLLEERLIRKRPGTVGISAAIKHKYNIEVVPHLICSGFTKEETEDALIDLNFLGIHNLLVVRGDPDKNLKTFIPTKGGHTYASELIDQISKLNNGIYLDEDIANPTPTQFSIGVAGYPEKHPESPNFETDIRVLKHKLDCGASYIVTQLFFDNKRYFDYLELCRKHGIDVPIVPGIKPISVKGHLSILPKNFYVEIPIELSKEVEKCNSNKEVEQVGIEWAIAQAKELIKAKVPSIHFYTMGRSSNIAKIAQAIY